MASCLDLIYKHPNHQNPPIDMTNEQTEKKGIEQIVVNRTCYDVLLRVQDQNNFIAATKILKQRLNFALMTV